MDIAWVFVDCLNENMSRKNFHSLLCSGSLVCLPLGSPFLSSVLVKHNICSVHCTLAKNAIYIINCLSPVLIFFYIFGTTVKSKYPNETMNVVKTFFYVCTRSLVDGSECMSYVCVCVWQCFGLFFRVDGLMLRIS